MNDVGFALLDMLISAEEGRFMKKKGWLIAITIAALIAGFIMFKPFAKEEKVVLLATDSGWDSQKFHNAVAKIILENSFDGYEMNFSTASGNMNWQSLLTGDIDVSIECWTENMRTYKEDKARGDIIDVGVVVPDSAQGFYVPRYVVEGDAISGVKPMAPDLRHVRDLAKYAHIFPDDETPSKGRIYGGLPGWSTDDILYKKYKYYGLEGKFTYIRLGSEAAIFTSLSSSYNLRQPWVGYCYEPTWVTGKLDLIRLEDEPYDEKGFFEGKTEFPQQELKIVSSRQFREKVSPEVYSFFQKYRTGSAGVSAALAYLDETKATHVDTAVWYLKNNDALIGEWLPAKNVAKLRRYLATM